MNDEIEDAITRIADLEIELTDMTDKWMRAEAELINVRNFTNRKVAETRQEAIQRFGDDMIEVAEDLHTGIEELPAYAKNEPEIVTKLREGLDSIERDFHKILDRHGINQA